MLWHHWQSILCMSTVLNSRAWIVDFLWIVISWQSPRRYRDIVTIATSADDRHQTLDIGKACDALHACSVCSHIPALSKHQGRDNGVRVNSLGRAKRWCQPCSHCGAEHPFAWYAGDRDWSDAVIQLATVQGTRQQTHATTAARQVCL